MALYELRETCASMLLERVTRWHAAIPLGHTDGGQRARMLAA